MNMHHAISPNIKFDKTLFIIVLVLMVFGLYLQFNIGTSLGDSLPMRIFLNQMKSVVVAFIVFCMFYFPSKVTRFLHDFSFIFVLLLMLLLVYVVARGMTSGGATRWINLRIITFQPSSLAHPVLVILFAKYFAMKKAVIPKIGFFSFYSEFKMLVWIAGTVIFLILLEKHLSTLIVLACTLLAMIAVCDFKKSLLAILIPLLFIGSLIVVNVGHEYRSTRMKIYSNYSLFSRALGVKPRELTRDERYQVQESLTAISSGGLLGVGQNQGRAKLKYVPDINSDFIFTIIAEERGFFGGAVIIALFTIFLYRVMKICSATGSTFENLLAFGLGINIFISAMVNIGVSLSALPATGLPLPFISHGGSALIVNVAMIAIILNISREKRADYEM